MEGLKATLAEKGYDIVDPDADSDSDDMMPGRIQSLEPNLAREKGKKAFEAGKYDKAIKHWQGGLKNILSSLCSGPEAMQDAALSEQDLTLNLNIAMAYMKKSDFEAAEKSVDKALARREALPPQLITKALYRKASAQRSMRRLDECMQTLKDLMTVEEGHAAARQMYQEVEREWSRQIRDQKKNMSKLFSKMQDEDKKEAQKGMEDRAERRRRSGIKWVEEDVDSAAFERGDSPPCDGKDWGMSFTRTVLWAMEEFCVEESPCLTEDIAHVSMWFLGASSTCELRWLRPKVLMSRLPGVKTLEVALIGFLGELDPENKRIPDPQAESLPPTKVASIPVDDEKERKVLMRVIKGTMQEALDGPLSTQPGKTAEASPSEALKTESGDAPNVDSADDGEGAAAAPAAAAAAAVAAAGESDSGPDGADTAPECQADGRPAADRSATPPASTVPPSVCFVAHPQLHRYFSDFFPAMRWLIENNVPTVVIGASEPDLSWKQDEVLLKAIGANIVVGKRESPYPMCLPDNPDVRKCSHIIGFKGGKAVAKERLTKLKLELLSQDYSVR